METSPQFQKEVRSGGSSLTEGSHYALSNIRAAKVIAGQRVLVNGATGAIGSAAVQILRAIGAYVVGCPRTTRRTSQPVRC